MSRDLSDVITRLSASIAAGDKNPHYRRAAAITGGVPVYADIGGVLVIACDGEIVSVDLDEDVTTRETDPRWRRRALVNAARSHPELANLHPARPEAARACPQCGGTGMIEIAGMECGICQSLGWVTTLSLDDLIGLNPRGDTLQREVLARLPELSTEKVRSMGLQILEDMTDALCAWICQLRPGASAATYSIVRNDFFTAIALWLQILGPHFSATETYAQLDSATQLLVEILIAIAERPVHTHDEIASLVIAGDVVGGALRDVYDGRPLFGTVNLPVVVESQLFATLRRCENLGDLVREARRQLGLVGGATR